MVEAGLVLELFRPKSDHSHHNNLLQVDLPPALRGHKIWNEAIRTSEQNLLLLDSRVHTSALHKTTPTILLQYDYNSDYALSIFFCLSALSSEGCIFISRNSLMAKSRCSRASAFSSG